MKSISLVTLLVVTFMALVGCGSSDGGTAKTGIDRYAEGKVDTNGVETRPSGTVIQRGDNGDK